MLTTCSLYTRRVSVLCQSYRRITTSNTVHSCFPGALLPSWNLRCACGIVENSNVFFRSPDGQRILRSYTSAERTGQAWVSYGEVREIWQRNAWARPRAVEGRTRQACLRKRIEGCVEAVDRAFQNGDERIPLESPRPELAKNHGRADGAVFFRRRLKTSGRLRGPQSERVIPALSLSQRGLLATPDGHGSEPHRQEESFCPTMLPLAGCSTAKRCAILNPNFECANRSAVSAALGVSALANKNPR